jgi:2-succinyl-5-enolpyruvyl-6-hydroxy-3-cyclohexene-1-carboxylate synthase
MTSDKTVVSLILQALKNIGIEQVVLSSGSRNAPFLIAFQQDDTFEKHHVLDERSAGFMALGMAQQTGKPLALCCTSGSALANYYPAVLEAYYQKIPLVILSADRPLHWIDQQDGQTIRQKDFFAPHIAYTANLLLENQARYNERQTYQALWTCAETQMPVHINVPLEEPLYQLTEKEKVHIPMQKHRLQQAFDQAQAQNIFENLKHTDKILLLAGQHTPKKAQIALEKLAKLPQIAVVSENLNTLHFAGKINNIDSLLATTKDENALHAEVLISFGGAVLSKSLKNFLRKQKPSKHYALQKNQDIVDTFLSLTDLVETDETLFLEALADYLPETPSTYKETWQKNHTLARQKQNDFLKQCPYSDLLVFAKLSACLPKNLQLHLGNSSCVRYAQFFDNLQGFANRGVSGIEGSLSTAVGAAKAHLDQQTLCVLGDLSFFYDASALTYAPKNLKVLVVNNNGGGIFRLIQQDKIVPGFEEFIEGKHEKNAQKLAEHAGFHYQKSSDADGLVKALNDFLHHTEPVLLEIFTPRLENDKVFQDFMQFLKF